MLKDIKNKIIGEISSFVSGETLKRIEIVLESAFSELDNFENESELSINYLDAFINAKSLEGCSEKTTNYYRSTIQKFLNSIQKSATEISTEDIREYLSEYQRNSGASKITVDNIRRNLSSFFSWLEDENYILKSPARRIHRIKTDSVVKEAFTDEQVEQLVKACSTERDRALLRFLSSTGMRIGELVLLNRDDINFLERECIVFGKGNKERIAYFDAQAKIELENYLASRSDDNPALFVSLKAPYQRLTINAAEVRIKKIGGAANVPKTHPHRFRRTLATNAIDKGMPIEQVQQLLGHQKIDTTLAYAMVKQSNVKNAHRKYLC